ncbi:uncharacterized protein LOC117110583 [Anneissia japonica]|uniref:uncharacterized protein LOC117110583 n=1 Tax=Anneissia japonica TaxID=1529436 RepID=UPI0014255BCC|nr:uncharacterized protein LOC117110583 [Anneissia japonica]
MLFPTLNLLCIAGLSFGSQGCITVVDYPRTDYISRFECCTSPIVPGDMLSYGRSFQVDSTDNITDIPWTVSATQTRYYTPDPPVPGNSFGVYYCKLVNDDVITIVQTTKIYSDAVIIPSNGTTSVSANVGDEVIVSFDVIGNVSRPFVWRKDGVRIASSDTDSLTFSPVKVNDAGVYEMHGTDQRNDRKHSFIKLIIRACPRHKWGPPDCTGDCEYCYNGGVCDDKTGLCICAPGFKGTTCETECSSYLFGRNCENVCKCRRRRLRVCLPDPYGCTCGAGYTGRDCFTGCQAGTFGVGCTQVCHCISGEYKWAPGGFACSCADYSSNTSCGSNDQGRKRFLFAKKECETGYFGENCDLKCTKCTTCINRLGKCLKGSCNSNWLKPYCEIGISDTTFSPANEGHLTDIYCTIFHGVAQGFHVMVTVKKHDVSDNITVPLQTIPYSRETTSYRFSVIPDIKATYSCVILQANESAQTVIKSDIFRPPSYNKGSLWVNPAMTTSSAIIINWTAWDNTTDDGDGPVIGYILHHRLSNIGTDEWKQNLFQNTLSGTASGLMWDTNYTFAVSAVRPGKGGEGPIGMQRISAKTLCGKPSHVRNVNHEVSEKEPRNIKVTWTDIEADAETLKCYNTTYIYSVYLKLNDNEGVGDVVYRGIDTQTTIDNIDVEATYVISVTVSNKDSESEFVESTLPDIAGFKSSAAIGGGVGAFVCTVLVVVIIIFFCKRKQSEKVSKPTEDAATDPADHAYGNVSPVKGYNRATGNNYVFSLSEEVNKHTKDTAEGPIDEHAYGNVFPIKDSTRSNNSEILPCKRRQEMKKPTAGTDTENTYENVRQGSTESNNHAVNNDDYMETTFVPENIYTALKQ